MTSNDLFQLPKGTSLLPREKPVLKDFEKLVVDTCVQVPKAKTMTRWEKFAAEKVQN